ncbi:DUF3482 domain-containing protein [Caenimonas terrae]|uniref:DUF3482 domain-containing protein n=1 Tax=Caenimonas terrae TaxID=696074 RepID=A0ABW0N9A4_9BURK
MQGTASTIAMDEASARQLVLVQAIEGADAQGRLLAPAERERIEREAVAAARASAAGDSAPGRAAIGRFLQRRAAMLLQAVGSSDRAIAALQQAGPGERWTATLVPVAALLLGISTDQVANPHQVNLLSKPLLLLLLWNLVVYALLLAHLLWPHKGGARPPRFAALRQWLAGLGEWGRRPRQLRAEVTAAFLARWQAVSGALYGQRLARVMHLAAAAWALGVALSLFFGGVWASYGVQWESTFLSASDVHRFLSVLFQPVTALFPWASFSLEEVRSLRVTGPLPPLPEAGDNLTGRRWVFLYMALLALVIVLPRLALAALAWWRERRLARAVPIDTADPYYRRLVGLLSPVQVTLVLLAHRDEDRQALRRALRAGPDGTLLRTESGERLRLVDLPADATPLSLPGASGQGRALRKLLGPWRRRPGPPAPALLAAREDSDVVLHVVSAAGDLAAGAQLLQWLGKPVLVLVRGERELAAAGAGAAAVLPFDSFARSWLQEPALLAAIGRCLPPHQAAGFGALARAWDQRNRLLLRDAMAVIARHLLEAARQTEDVGKAPRSLISLLSPGEREAHERRSHEAMAAVVERLQRSDAQATASLLALHGIEPSAAGLLNTRLERKFVVQQAISAGQAGVAGAATGAAMGVSLDLLTAGLTLGLAAVAGAVVGGGAAWVAAVWKNQATPAGNSVVQLSDDMLQAMTEAGLLRYLAVIHFGRGPDLGPDAGGAGEIRPQWRSEVVAAVERRSADLQQQWAAARAGRAALDPGAALTAMLESIALSVLRRLYPDAP